MLVQCVPKFDQNRSELLVVEESRILQVRIFNTLQDNLVRVDFSKVLLDVMTIADEVDSQLKQASSVTPNPPHPLGQQPRLKSNPCFMRGP